MKHHSNDQLILAGLKVVIDLARPSGQRVRSIEARCGDCTVPVYQKLDLNANYTIIMSQYLAMGGDGLVFKKVVGFRSFGEFGVESGHVIVCPGMNARRKKQILRLSRYLVCHNRCP